MTINFSVNAVGTVFVDGRLEDSFLRKQNELQFKANKSKTGNNPTAAQELQKKELAFANLKTPGLAYEMLLIRGVARYAPRFSTSTCDKVDWEVVATTLNPQHPRRDKQVYGL